MRLPTPRISAYILECFSWCEITPSEQSTSPGVTMEQLLMVATFKCDEIPAVVGK